MRVERAVAVSTAPVKVSQDRYKWMALLVVVLGNLVTTIDTSIINFALPALADALRTDISTVVWVSLAYILVNAGLIFTLGWLSDTVGRGRIFILGVLVNAVLLVPLALVQGVWQMVALRVGQGVGTSMIHANSVSLIVAAFPDRERGRALGISMGISSIGLGIGPLMGGLILEHLEWRALFYLRIPFVLAVLAVAWLYLERGVRRAGDSPVDWPGALLLFGGLVGLLLAVNRAGALGFASALVWGALLLSLVLLGVFGLQERRAANPILDPALLRRREFTVTTASLTVQFQAWNIVVIAVPFLLVRGLAYSPSLAGAVLSVYSLVRVISPLTGWLADRFRPGAVAAFGLGLMVVGALMLMRVDAGTSLWFIAAALAVAGVGGSFFGPANNSVLAGAVPRDRLGTASAAIAAGRQVGMSSGTAVAAAVLAARGSVYAGRVAPGEAEPPEAVVLAAGDTFLVAAVLSLVALLLGALNALPRRGDGGRKGAP